MLQFFDSDLIHCEQPVFAVVTTRKPTTTAVSWLRGPTFLLVQRGQDAVVAAHLEVDLLLHALWDGALRDDDADARLDGAQDAAVAVEDAAGGGHHRVALVLVVVLQGARADGDIIILIIIIIMLLSGLTAPQSKR